jgi:hypothetical protein
MDWDTLMLLAETCRLQGNEMHSRRAWRQAVTKYNRVRVPSLVGLCLEADSARAGRRLYQLCSVTTKARCS